MSNRRKIVIAILLLIVVSCGKNTCTSVANIDVSELLVISSNDKHYNYCELLGAAVEGDEKSIKELTLLQFDDAVGYDHGQVIVDLIVLIGETKYIDAIREVAPKEKSMVKGYVDVGLEYGHNTELEGQPFNVAFPMLYAFLNEE